MTWLLWHAGFGARPAESQLAADLGPADTLDRLLQPDDNGVPPAPEPWNDADYESLTRQDVNGKVIGNVVSDWVQAMVVSERQLVEQLTWFWHGHLVVGFPKVRVPFAMVLHLRRFRRLALDGDLGSLLTEMTSDAAMLQYLDGATSTAGAPNENFSRELLELFALGIGNYTEADVTAGAVALTGITLRRDAPNGVLTPRRHDDTPQAYLGRTGVHDVETVISAVLSHPACGPFVARRMARHLLGPGLDVGLTDEWGRDFASGGYRFAPLLRTILTFGVDHPAQLTPEVQSPLPWFVSCARALEIETLDRRVARGLRSAGQIPAVPPNVAGWPHGNAWLSAAAVMARANLAFSLAAAAPSSSFTLSAAAEGASSELASLLGVTEGFGRDTTGALGLAGTPVERLALALASPEVVIR